MTRLRRSDLIQLGIGLVFGVAVFLPWYETAAANQYANIDGKTGELSAWEVHPVLRWLLLAVAVSALLSAWQTIRGQKTELPRGEMAAIVSVLALGLVVFAGLISRPGEPSGAISLAYGWFVALAAGVAAVVTALARMPAQKRTPPGL